MSINLVVAVTDGDWFEGAPRQPNLAETNFWAPSAASFRALRPGELFLFKLHAPGNVIVGGGIFAYANALPCSLAWEAFREANGANSAQQMRARIARYRRAELGDRADFEIGCRVLTQPFFSPKTVGQRCRRVGRRTSFRSRPTTRTTRRVWPCGKV
jgi:putative restriction endonuclease